MKVCIINGPNLNLLGQREPHIYGYDTLADIEARCQAIGKTMGWEVEFSQSNYEGALVDAIQSAIGTADAIVINAGAYTHTSIAIHDALKAFKGYIVELHISNVHLREPFRHHSYISYAADSVVAGLGVDGYAQVVRMLPELVSSKT